MSKRIILFVLIIFSFTSVIYGQRVDSGCRFTIGSDFGIGRGHGFYDGWIGGGPHPEKAPGWEYGVLLTPRIGLRIDDKREFGIMYRYESTQKNETHSYGAYYERTYLRFQKVNLRLLVDWQYSYNHPVNHDSHNFTEIGATPGIAYHFEGTGLDIRLCYLFLGFNDSMRERKEFGGCLGRGNWIIDAGIRRLSIGMSYTF